MPICGDPSRSHYMEPSEIPQYLPMTRAWTTTFTQVLSLVSLVRTISSLRTPSL